MNLCVLVPLANSLKHKIPLPSSMVFTQVIHFTQRPQSLVHAKPEKENNLMFDFILIFKEIDCIFLALFVLILFARFA